MTLLAIIGAVAVIYHGGAFLQWLREDGAGLIGRWLVDRDEGRHRRGL